MQNSGRKPAVEGQRGREAEIDRVLTTNAEADRESFERSYLNSASAWAPIIPAATSDELAQHEDFWAEERPNLSPTAQRTRAEMLAAIARRRADLTSEADAAYASVAPKVGAAAVSPLMAADQANMDELLAGSFPR